MAKRFTDSEKWDDPWFSELPNKFKLLWILILDKCDHAGFYKVNLKMAEFCTGEKYELQEVKGILDGRIREISPEKWFIPKFIDFQYGELNDESRVHKSVYSILKKEGVFKGCSHPMDRLKDKDKDKDKDNTTDIGGLLLKNRFLSDLRLTYKMLNVDSEILACISWHKNKGTKVKNWDRSITNWLKIAYEKTGVVGFEKPESKLKDKDPNCKLCNGTGFVYNQSISKDEFCSCRIKSAEKKERT